MEEAAILLRMGRFREAEELLSTFSSLHPTSSRGPEAQYWLGAVRLRLQGKKGGEPIWRGIIESHEDSRWAWKAGGALKSTAFSIGEGEKLAWPPAEILKTLERPPAQPLNHSKRSQAERDAIEFLLRHQRDDGSWISPSEVGQFSDREPDPFTEAVTAICGQGLIPYREEPRVKEALSRAMFYLFEARKIRMAAEKKVYFMDYAVWRNTYVLWFFADCIRTGAGTRKDLEPAMKELVTELRESQKSGGGWTYYISSDLQNTNTPLNVSMSFMTAAVLLALREAKDAGISIPKEMSDAALGCLERMRYSDGVFEYMLFHEKEDAPRRSKAPGSAGRGPLCALALHRWGRMDLEGIQKGLNAFLEYRHTYAREQGKTLLHARLDAQGSHYLMFDYANAAAAIQQLPQKKHSKYRQAVLKLILDSRSEEGSFVDNPLIGWHYGTGMALCALHHLCN